MDAIENANNALCEMYPERFVETTEEAQCVLDAITDGRDPIDDLDEYRFWRSPRGRIEEEHDAFLFDQ